MAIKNRFRYKTSSGEKKSKYGNKKVVFEGFTYDSKRELQRYLFLKDAEDKGIISNLQRQVKFNLIPANSVYRALTYVADFTFNVNDRYIVADAKGLVLPEFKIKQKIFYDKYKNQIYIFKKLSDINKIIDMTK